MPPKKKDIGFNLDRFKTKSWSQMWNELRLGESYASLALGLVVVVIVAVIAVMFIKGNATTPSINQDVSSESTENTQETKTENTYTIGEGESLWTIAEKKYNSGYKWVDIAKANNIANPDIVEPGTKLTLPVLSKEDVQKDQSQAKTEVPEATIATEPTQGATPTLPPPVQQVQGEKITGNTYTVKAGDFLWDIAVRAYGDGYKWVDIARANKLENPDLVFSENVLKLPR